MAENQYKMPTVFIPVQVDEESLAKFREVFMDAIKGAVSDAMKDVKIERKDADKVVEPDIETPAMVQARGGQPDPNRSYQPSVRQDTNDEMLSTVKRIADKFDDTYELVVQINESIQLQD